jgi:hypothetical protein
MANIRHCQHHFGCIAARAKCGHKSLLFAYLSGLFNIKVIMSQVITDFASAANALLDRCEAAILILHNGTGGNDISAADRAALALLAARQTAITTELEALAGSEVPVTGVPVISIPLAVTGTVGQPFSFQIQASNGPTSYSATSLPTWATVNTTTGLITGTPTVSGVNLVKINASNASGPGLDPVLTITVS